MRVTVPLSPSSSINWHALHDHAEFLFRRIADRDRSLLFVEALYDVQRPQFADHCANEWYFGHLLYELKDQLEPALDPGSTVHGSPLEKWSVARWVIEWTAGGCFLHAFRNDLEEGERFCQQLFSDPIRMKGGSEISWRTVFTREEYLDRANGLLMHIQRGDIYEVNFCTERRADAIGFDPYGSFAKLLERTDARFAAFHRLGEKFALCASPERFLSFDRGNVIAQPMKGTRPRSQDPIADRELAQELASDPKERSENIMALDVMRHDLSKIAASATVKVKELCAVQQHRNVHQMISTITANIKEGFTPIDVVHACFPMASMTGAPKFRAMQLIDKAEQRSRGLFSGSLGFFAPDGSADLNVVIRTVLHDATTGKCSLFTGSALTAQCDPQKEWEECELKARSVINALK